MAQVVENRVQLGCGSLILIAVIVLFFSNRGDRDNHGHLADRLDRIERRLDAIEKKIDTFIVKP